MNPLAKLPFADGFESVVVEPGRVASMKDAGSVTCQDRAPILAVCMMSNRCAAAGTGQQVGKDVQLRGVSSAPSRARERLHPEERVWFNQAREVVGKELDRTPARLSVVVGRDVQRENSGHPSVPQKRRDGRPRPGLRPPPSADASRIEVIGNLERGSAIQGQLEDGREDLCAFMSWYDLPRCLADGQPVRHPARHDLRPCAVSLPDPGLSCSERLQRAFLVGADEYDQCEDQREGIGGQRRLRVRSIINE